MRRMRILPVGLATVGYSLRADAFLTRWSGGHSFEYREQATTYGSVHVGTEGLRFEHVRILGTRAMVLFGTCTWP